MNNKTSKKCYARQTGFVVQVSLSWISYTKWNWNFWAWWPIKEKKIPRSYGCFFKFVSCHRSGKQQVPSTLSRRQSYCQKNRIFSNGVRVMIIFVQLGIWSGVCACACKSKYFPVVQVKCLIWSSGVLARGESGRRDSWQHTSDETPLKTPLIKAPRKLLLLRTFIQMIIREWLALASGVEKLLLCRFEQWPLPSETRA